MNNSNESLLVSNLDETSLTNLDNRMPADIAFIIIGSITVFLNMLIILNISVSKLLHTKCYFLISNSSVAAIIYTGSFAITAMKRIIRLHLRISEVNTKIGCNGEMFTCYFGQSACASLPLVTALDRLFATLAPLKYRSTGKSLVIVLASMGWGYASIDSAFSFYGSDMYSIVLNCNLVSATDILYIIQSSCAIALAIAVVIIYITVMAVLRYQIKSAKSRSENIAAIKSKLQIKVAKSLSIDSCIHLVTQVATRVGLTLLPLFPNSNKWTSASYMRMIIFIGLSATVFIFSILNSDFKISMGHMLRLKFLRRRNKTKEKVCFTTKVDKEKLFIRLNNFL